MVEYLQKGMDEMCENPKTCFQGLATSNQVSTKKNGVDGK